VERRTKEKQKTTLRGTGQLPPWPLHPLLSDPRRSDPPRVILVVTIEAGFFNFRFFGHPILGHFSLPGGSPAVCVCCVCACVCMYIYIYIYIYLYEAYSLRGTSPAPVAREGPYAAVTFCCRGMRRESGHWAGEGLGSGGWERGSLLATECHGCVRAFNGHRPPPASRKAGETQMAQWAYGALSRLALLGVFCISRRRWTGTPCQIRQD